MVGVWKCAAAGLKSGGQIKSNLKSSQVRLCGTKITICKSHTRRCNVPQSNDGFGLLQSRCLQAEYQQKMGGEEFVAHGGGALPLPFSSPSPLVASLKNHRQAKTQKAKQAGTSSRQKQRKSKDTTNGVEDLPQSATTNRATPKAPTQPPPSPPCQPNPKRRRMATPEGPDGPHRPRRLAAEQPYRRRRTARSMPRRWASRPG